MVDEWLIPQRLVKLLKSVDRATGLTDHTIRAKGKRDSHHNEHTWCCS